MGSKVPFKAVFDGLGKNELTVKVDLPVSCTLTGGSFPGRRHKGLSALPPQPNYGKVGHMYDTSQIWRSARLLSLKPLCRRPGKEPPVKVQLTGKSTLTVSSVYSIEYDCKEERKSVEKRKGKEKNKKIVRR